MQIKTYEIKDKVSLPLCLQGIFNKEDYCVVDIETTGLSRKYNQVILIGILYNLNDKIILKQFFAEDINEEALILKEFKDIFKNFSFVITYNGAAFDIPFLKQRFIYNNIKWDFHSIKNIDLLQCIRREKEHIPLENFKLKTVERFMGINRKDTISGKDSVLLYKEYTKNPSPSLLKTILLHNYEDIYYLNISLNIFQHIPFSKDDVLGRNIELNYYNNKISFDLFPRNIIINQTSLTIKGKTQILNNLYNIIHYDTNFDFNWEADTGDFELKIPVLNGPLSSGVQCSYINLANYNLNKDNFKGKDFYNEKYFHNDIMILKYGDNISFDLVFKFFSLILKSIFV